MFWAISDCDGGGPGHHRDWPGQREAGDGGGWGGGGCYRASGAGE